MFDGILPLVVRGNPSPEELAAITTAYTSFLLRVPQLDKDIEVSLSWKNANALDNRRPREIPEASKSWVNVHRMIARKSLDLR